MADKKISALTDGGTLQADDELVVARAGANYKIRGDALGGSSSADVALSSDVTGAGDRGYILNADALARIGEKWRAVYGDVRFGSRAIINLRFDDGKAESYTTVFPELLSRGLPGDFCVIKSSALNSANGYITSAQAQEMQSKGCHFLSHSVNHGADPASLADFITEVTDPIAYFNDTHFLYVDGFVQPGTWVDTYNFDTVAKTDGSVAGAYLRQYATSQNYVTDDFVDTASGEIGQALPVRRKYGYSHLSADSMTLADIEARIDAAITYGTALCLTFHPQYIDTATYITLADFQSVLDYVQTKRDAGLIDVMTANGMAYALPGVPANWIGDPDFTKSATGAAVIWQGTGASWTIDSLPGGQYAAKVNSSSYLKQSFAVLNMRTIQVTADVKRAALGTAATARLRFRTYNAAGGQRGSTVDITLAATDDWQTFTACFGMRTDAVTATLEIESTDANYVHFRNVQAVKI